MNEKEKTLYSGILRKLSNTKEEDSPFVEQTQIRYFELNLLQMTLGYKKKQTDEDMSRIFGFKQVISYSVNLKKEERNICEWDHGFSVKLYNGKKYLLFCETIEELLNWIEGFRIFFDRKTQKLLKKFSNNETILNVSNYNQNPYEYSKSKFNEMFICDELKFEILGENYNNSEIINNGKKRSSFILQRVKCQDFNIICRYTEILEKKLLNSKYKTLNQKKLNILLHKFYNKFRIDFNKHIYIFSKKFDEKNLKENKKSRVEEEDDWTLEILTKKPTNKTISKEYLKKEIKQTSKTNETTNKSNNNYKIKLVDENDITIIENNDDIIPSFKPQSNMFQNKVRNLKIEREEKDILAELNENNLQEKSPLDNIRRDKFNEMTELYSTMENKINFDKQKNPIIKNDKNANNENYQKSLKINDKIVEKTDKKEEKKIVKKTNEEKILVNDKENKLPIKGNNKHNKLDLNLINTEEDINIESSPKNNLSRSKSESKIAFKEKPVEYNKNNDIVENDKILYASEDIKHKDPKVRSKSELNISGISSKTFATISSPHFGNISIIAQRFNKVDNIDDWKDYVNVDTNNKKDKNKNKN